MEFPSWWSLMITFFLAGLFSVVFYKSLSDSFARKWMLSTLLYRLVCGLFIGLIYHLHYQHAGDTFALHADGVAIAELFTKSVPDYFSFLFLANEQNVADFDLFVLNGNNRAIFFSKWVSAFSLITDSNYWLTSLWFSFLSFVPSYLLFEKIQKSFPERKVSILFLLMGLPSCALWTSGVFKESLLWSCICLALLITLHFFPLDKKERPVHFLKTKDLVRFLLFCASLYIIYSLKYYYLAVLAPILAGYAFHYFLRHYLHLPSAWRTLSSLGIATGIILLVSFSHHNLRLGFLMEVIVENNHKMADQTEKKENLIGFSELTPEVDRFTANLPIAIWEGLARPYLWEKGSLLKKAAAIERSLILAFVVASVLMAVFLRIKPDSLAVFGLVYCFSLWVLLTYAAPNLGNLNRYQSCYLPFMLLIFSFVWRKDLSLPFLNRKVN